jgi:hypothetical protein
MFENNTDLVQFIFRKLWLQALKTAKYFYFYKRARCVALVVPLNSRRQTKECLILMTYCQAFSHHSRKDTKVLSTSVFQFPEKRESQTQTGAI